MKRMLNTLYVTTQDAYLARDGETVAIRVEQETKLRVPLHTLDGIVCLGRVGCSPALMASCGERDVAITWLTQYGRFQGRFIGPTTGNVLLRRAQYRMTDAQPDAAAIARPMLLAKIANCRTVLQRAIRDHGDDESGPALADAARHLALMARAVPEDAPLDTLRGLEGDAAREYFRVFDHLIVAQKPEFAFTRRTRRPPLDPVNALLSFLYALLTHDCVSALETVGLDPQVGFLHRDRPGRPSLALDLMEEFRPVLADRVALSLINRKQVQPQGFRQTESGAVLMDDDTRKALLVAYQTRKQEELQHPFLQEKIPAGLLSHAQALLLARYLRGDLDGYPAFVWR